MLNKAKAESLEFKNRFLEKEKESQEEFTKNVNLQKESRELNNKIGELNIKIKEQGEQIEIQRHRIEKNEQDIKLYLKTIEELKNKEKISEWVPKAEFNRLNEEYTELVKELEVKYSQYQELVLEISRLKKELRQDLSHQEVISPGRLLLLWLI